MISLQGVCTSPDLPKINTEEEGVARLGYTNWVIKDLAASDEVQPHCIQCVRLYSEALCFAIDRVAKGKLS
jgi:hypothetical protein